MKDAFRVLAAFFGMILGLVGLGGCCRVAHKIWGAPSAIGEGIRMAAVVLWAVRVVLYVAKMDRSSRRSHERAEPSSAMLLSSA
jgi:tellurite resistance protein TehA-like permease